MCSGRVDLLNVLKAFSKGADGVFIGGCYFNECYYVTGGNYSTLSMVLITKRIMEEIGLDPRRLQLGVMSAGEGIRFAELINNFNKEIAELGPLGVSEGLDDAKLKTNLELVRNLVPYIKLVERERLRMPVKSEEAYREFFAGSEFNKLFYFFFKEKFIISQIVSSLQQSPLNTSEIANAIALSPSEASKYLASSSKQRFIKFDENLKQYALA
jgi:coenzyme F420-reducing hydrogenase delta subunit